MNKPIEQDPPSITETTDSQDQKATLSRRVPTLAKVDLKVGSKPVVHAYTIHARPKNHPTPIQAEVAVSTSITQLNSSSMTPQQHHRKSAKIHAQASTHHNEAAKSHESGDIVAAVLHARLAYEYAAQATEHGDLLDRPSYIKEQDNQALIDPLQGASEEEVDETIMRTLNIL